MLTSEKLLEENQSQLFRIEEMLEVYSDFTEQPPRKMLSSSRKEQKHNQELILQLSATSHDFEDAPNCD